MRLNLITLGAGSSVPDTFGRCANAVITAGDCSALAIVVLRP